MKTTNSQTINSAHVNKRFMSGLSLIEILVTVVVLSIGLLGIAGMQAFGMRYNNDSYMRSQAVAYANQLVERMHANPDAVNTGAYKTALDALILAGCTTAGDPSVSPAPNCSGSNAANDCSITQMASQDVFRMMCGYANGASLQTGVANDLPLGGITITCNDDASFADANPCTNDNARGIAVSWQDPDDKGNTASRLQVQISAQFL
ncbi:MAG: type IV pilus modification protein PilV [Gammaproteobacteria bacterium]